MGGNKAQTVGYRYSLGVHLALCHGPVDAIREILASESPELNDAVFKSEHRHRPAKQVGTPPLACTHLVGAGGLGMRALALFAVATRARVPIRY